MCYEWFESKRKVTQTVEKGRTPVVEALIQRIKAIRSKSRSQPQPESRPAAEKEKAVA